MATLRVAVNDIADLSQFWANRDFKLLAPASASLSSGFSSPACCKESVNECFWLVTVLGCRLAGGGWQSTWESASRLSRNCEDEEEEPRRLWTLPFALVAACWCAVSWLRLILTEAV